MSAPATTFDRLPETIVLGTVSLTVADLERSIGFYERVIGLQLLQRDGDRAVLGTAARELVEIVERRDAWRPESQAGLYHFALLFESREELAQVTLRAIKTRTHIDGASNHHTHEAIYLPDPDGNGIELAWDFPRSQWPDPADVSRYRPDPLDIDGLLALVRDGNPARHAGDGLRIGHLHLHVSALEPANAFYVDALGFRERNRIGDVAVFVAAGDYHHHLAYNLWAGRGVPAATDPDATTGLRYWTIGLPSVTDLDAAAARLDTAGFTYDRDGDTLVAADPAGIVVRLTAT